jgi:hypothetical protein
VKPRKIPIGAIKMPGFFTKKKEKEADGADNELLEKAEEGAVDAEKPKPEEKQKRPGLLANFKLRNPFAKKPASGEEPAAEQPTENGEAEKKDDAAKTETESKDEVTAEATDVKPEGDAATEEKKEATDAEKKEEEAKEDKPAKKSVLSTISSIKLPQVNFASLLPKRNKGKADDIEMGNGPNNKANLASMETLDDSQKDNNSEVKDTVDKNGSATEGEALVQKDEKKDDEDEQIPQNMTLLERVQSYKCTLGE